MDWLLALLWEGEVFIGDMVAAVLGNFGHAAR
jgi:hypothetical protein